MKTISETILTYVLILVTRNEGKLQYVEDKKKEKKKTLPRLNVWATYPLQASLTSIHRRETMMFPPFKNLVKIKTKPDPIQAIAGWYSGLNASASRCMSSFICSSESACCSKSKLKGIVHSVSSLMSCREFRYGCASASKTAIKNQESKKCED